MVRLFALILVSSMHWFVSAAYPPLEQMWAQPSYDQLFAEPADTAQISDWGGRNVALPLIKTWAAIGGFFLYGARNGQLCWHSYEVGHQWRGYQVSQSIRLAPLLVDGAVIVVGSDGRIMVLDAGSAAQIWSKKLLDVVTAPPAAGSPTRKCERARFADPLVALARGDDLFDDVFGSVGLGRSDPVAEPGNRLDRSGLAACHFNQARALGVERRLIKDPDRSTRARDRSQGHDDHEP